MPKFAAPAVQDAPLDVIATATEMYFCNGQPTSRADAITRARAPAIAMVAGDFVKSGSGARILTVAGKTVTANASGAVDHVALCTGSALLYVTDAPSQTANSGAPIVSNSFTVEASALV